MNIATVDHSEFRRRLRRGSLCLRLGPFTVRVRSDVANSKLLHWVYSPYVQEHDDGFADFHVWLYRGRGLRRWWRPQVRLQVDGQQPFMPFPEDTALPFLEWGLNWCVATRANQYLMLHAGAVEKHGRVLLLPAWPGSGKSTLTAALMLRGWRLLSDEFGLVQPEDLSVAPLPRPIPLKNESIAVIRGFDDQAVMGPAFPKTRKGTVAHLRPTQTSIDRGLEAAPARWVVFPKYEAGAEARLKPLTRERAFLKLSGNSFNYEMIGLRGFETAAGLIENCQSLLFRYSDLDQAVACLDRLADA